MLHKIDTLIFDYDWFSSCFPTCEIRSKKEVYELLQSRRMDAYGYYEGNTVVATMLVWSDDSYVFIENFAVHPNQQNRGIGTKMLQEFCNVFDSKVILLEVESPHDIVSKKRVTFYERNHFVDISMQYMQPLLREQSESVLLRVMVYKNASTIMSDEVKDFLFHVVYKNKKKYKNTLNED